MVAEERRGACLIDFTGGDHHHQLNDILLLGFDAQTIEIEKQVGCGKGRTLVAIDERMVLRDTEEVGGSEFTKIGLAVRFFLLGTGEGRFQHALVAYTWGAAVEAQLLGVHRLHEFSRMMLGHLASAR
jgi:hypothetical protein